MICAWTLGLTERRAAGINSCCVCFIMFFALFAYLFWCHCYNSSIFISSFYITIHQVGLSRGQLRAASRSGSERCIAEGVVLGIR